MIAAQKQLIENADAIQERIAMVQKEGKLWERWVVKGADMVIVNLVNWL